MKTNEVYYHKTDGGAIYLCSKAVKGTTEGDMKYVVARLDGEIELYRKSGQNSQWQEAIMKHVDKLIAAGNYNLPLTK